MEPRTNRKQIIPTVLFNEAFEPRIQKAIAAAVHSNEGTDETDSGVIGELSREAAYLLGDVSDEALCRRIWAIRACEYRTLNPTTADVLLMALGTSLWDVDMPILAGTENGAREMVDGYCFAREIDMSLLEQRTLAKSLLHFCRGMTEALYTDLDDVAKVIADKVEAKKTQYKGNQHGRVVEAA